MSAALLCPRCNVTVALTAGGQGVCGSCSQLVGDADVLPAAPPERLFRVIHTDRGVRFVGRQQLVIVIVLLLFVLPVGLVLAFAKTEVRIEDGFVEVRSFAMPTTKTGRFPLGQVTDAAWVSEPAKGGGLAYAVTLLLADGQTIKLGFAVFRESAVYVANALRQALRSAKGG